MDPAGSYVGDAGDFLLVNRLARRTEWLHGAMTAYAGAIGISVLAALLAVGWWLARRQADPRSMAALAWAALGTLAAIAVNQPIVNAVAERRPYETIPHALVLVARSADYGFPSDHATMAGAVATGLCYVNRRLGITAWVAALLLGFARVYVGAHYPHDVAAGLALGATVVVLGQLVARPVLTRLLRRLSTTRLRPFIQAGHPAPQPAPGHTGAMDATRPRPTRATATQHVAGGVGTQRHAMEPAVAARGWDIGPDAQAIVERA